MMKQRSQDLHIAELYIQLITRKQHDKFNQITSMTQTWITFFYIPDDDRPGLRKTATHL